MRGRGRHRVRTSPRKRILRVAAVLFVVAGAVAFTAFGSTYLDRSAARADEKFVAGVAAEGRPVPDAQTQALVIQAAHKLCDSRTGSTTTTQRRASVLTSEEIDAVQRTFGGDTPAFVKVAKSAYCPLNR